MVLYVLYFYSLVHVSNFSRVAVRLSFSAQKIFRQVLESSLVGGDFEPVFMGFYGVVHSYFLLVGLVCFKGARNSDGIGNGLGVHMVHIGAGFRFISDLFIFCRSGKIVYRAYCGRKNKCKKSATLNVALFS